MDELESKIELLAQRIAAITAQQTSMSRQILELTEELQRLRLSRKLISADTITPVAAVKNNPANESAQKVTEPRSPAKPADNKSISRVTNHPRKQVSLENFIGGNIASKVGILVTVIGVFIGAKYAIDRNLISPEIRILLGYLAGAALLFFGLRLRKKYTAFSAVLVAGAIAILYFITYIAYNFYGFIPQVPAFILMFLLTGFTVYLAILYDKMIIAHLGMAGAYGIPFLLSDGSGRVEILFAYMVIINMGILFVSFYKYWKSLSYLSFVLTWIIYLSWYFFKPDQNGHAQIAWIFLILFFVLFYLNFMAYKLLKKEKFELRDVLLILLNSTVFYGMGYTLLKEQQAPGNTFGLFTLLNALVHFAFFLLLRFSGSADKALARFLSSLAIAFITIAVPVQFKGHWITLFWTAESVILFYTARTRDSYFYELLSVPLSLLAFASLSGDWLNHVDDFAGSGSKSPVTPFINIVFFTGLICSAGFGFLTWLQRKKQYTQIPVQKDLFALWQTCLPVIFILVNFLGIFSELNGYFTALHARVEQKSALSISFVDDVDLFRGFYLILYTGIFISALALIANFLIRQQRFLQICSWLLFLSVLLFLSGGLYFVGELRTAYIHHELSRQPFLLHGFLAVRYFLMLNVIFNLVLLGRTLKKSGMQNELPGILSLFIHFTVLTLISNEFIHWMDLFGHTDQYKLGLSITWGCYALFVIIVGIWKRKKLLRMGAIILFIVTLLKLFFYDLNGMSTIAKTIAFISLGILLLLVSFLYNKYREIILRDD